MTCRNVVLGKTTFWLHDLGRSGERAVRRRSLVIKELSRSTLPLVFLATFLADSAESSQVTSHLQPTRQRNLGLNNKLRAASGAQARNVPPETPAQRSASVAPRPGQRHPRAAPGSEVATSWARRAPRALEAVGKVVTASGSHAILR